MTTETIASVAGVILSLAFAYVPGLKDLYNKLDTTRKAAVMAGLIIVTGLGAFGLGCAGWFGLQIPCEQAGLEMVVRAIVGALVANVATYTALVRPFKS